MATPAHPITISIKNANLTAGEVIKVTNFTSGGTIRAKTNSSGEVIINPANEGLTWANDDVIQIESNGRIPFNSRTTISAGKAKAVSSASTAEAGPAVNL